LAKTTIWRLAVPVVVLASIVLFSFWRMESSARGKGADKERLEEPAPAASAPRLAKPPASSQPATAAVAPSRQVTASPDARAATSAAQLAEASLMERLRTARAAGQHPLAIQLARDGNRRFHDSSFAPERHSILIHSLADNEQRTEARGEAELMVNHYPDSDWVREIERYTGAHRHRNVRLNDAGDIEYY
jgi:hypothetical protein